MSYQSINQSINNNYYYYYLHFIIITLTRRQQTQTVPRPHPFCTLRVDETI